MTEQRYRRIILLLVVVIVLLLGDQVINLALLTDIQHAVVPGRG
jgi:hypothetical protein